MTDFDLERFGGNRVRLFIIQRQSRVLRFCTGKTPFINGAFTYTPATIDHSEIKQTPEPNKDKITITFAHLLDPNASAIDIPSTQELGAWWRPYVPSDEIRVTCLVAHRGSTDAPRVEWTGIVKQPAFTDTECTLTCTPGSARGDARNQGPKIQRGCWKLPYSQGPRGCGMQLDDFEVPATLTSAVGVTLQAAAFATAPLSLFGGWIEWTNDDGIVEQRTILSHSGNTITIQYGSPDLVPTLALSAWPNCELTWQACADRFDDPENHYGGAIYLPVQDPMQESMSWG